MISSTSALEADLDYAERMVRKDSEPLSSQRR